MFKAECKAVKWEGEKRKEKEDTEQRKVNQYLEVQNKQSVLIH